MCRVIDIAEEHATSRESDAQVLENIQNDGAHGERQMDFNTKDASTYPGNILRMKNCNHRPFDSDPQLSFELKKNMSRRDNVLKFNVA